MKSLDDLEVAGRTVLVRADFNVPLADGPDGSRVITDDGRIRAALPTLGYLRDAGAKVVVVAHMGRAKGEVVPALSLAPVATRLAELLGAPVVLSSLADAPAVVAAEQPGAVVLLENIRFDARETSKVIEERQSLAAELGMPYQNLINLYLRDCAVHERRLDLTWLP